MNKLKFSFLAILLSSIAISFVSCGDDDEEEVGSTNPADVIGTWRFSSSESYYTANGQRVPAEEVKNSSDAALTYCLEGTITFKEDGEFESTQLGTGTYELSDGELALYGTFRNNPFKYAKGEEWKKFMNLHYYSYGDLEGAGINEEELKEDLTDSVDELISYVPQKIRFCVKGGKLLITNHILYVQDMGDDWRKSMEEAKDDIPSDLLDGLDKLGHVEVNIEVHNVFTK